MGFPLNGSRLNPTPPGTAEYIRGVLNLRGVMVPIIDLRCRFGQGKTDAGPMHVVIIVSVDNRLVGLLADRVLDIVSVEVANIQPVPQLVRSARVTFLAGLVTVENFMIALIDLANLLSAQAEAEGLSAVDAKSPPLAPAPSAQAHRHSMTTVRLYHVRLSASPANQCRRSQERRYVAVQ